MARVRELAGLPIAQHSSPNTGGRMSGHRGLVLHIAEGYYQGTISWQMNADQRYADGTRVTTSSTWIVGRDRGQWAQMVDTDTVAWAQRSGSNNWLSIELAGFTRGHRLNPGGWERPTAWQVEACAQLLAWAHRQHGVPLQVADSPSGRGLGYHSMGAPAWGHSQCPGPDIIAARGAIVARAQQIVRGVHMEPRDVWQHRVPPEASVARTYPSIRDDGYRSSTWVQYGYQWARRAADRASELLAGQAAILARLDGGDDGATRQAIRDELDRHRAELLDELRGELRDVLEQRAALGADAVVDELARRLGAGDA